MSRKLEILPLDEQNQENKEAWIVKDPKGAIILVHGICHGAWCWKKFMKFFAERGYQCYAISLPGHGKNEDRKDLQNYCLSDYVEAVKDSMGRIREDMAKHGLGDVKPFLLGHSMGGAVVQQYLGKYEEDVQGAVLFAPATAPNMDFGEMVQWDWNLFLAAAISWNWHNFFKGFRKKMVHDAAFFSSRDPSGKVTQRVKDTSEYEALLQQESSKVTFGLLKSYTENYNIHIPVFVLGSYADLYFGEESLKKTAGIYAEAGNDNTALVILKRLCHDMMLDDDEWEASAEPVLHFMEDPAQFVKDHKYPPEEKQ